MAEISDDDFKVLQQSKLLLDQLLTNPKTVREQQKLIKEIHPNVQTIEDNPIMEEVRSLAKRFDEDKRARRDREIDQQLDADFNHLRQQGWQDSGLDKLKKFMVDNDIKSPIHAAAAYDRANPPEAVPPSYAAPTGWNFGDLAQNDDDKALFQNEDAWAEKEAAKVIQEMRAPERIRTN